VDLLGWTNLALNIFASLFVPVLLVTGWLVTRRHLIDQAVAKDAIIAQLLSELAREQIDHKEEVERLRSNFNAEYTRMDREYARMVVAKDDQIDRLQGYCAEWKNIGLGSLTGLKVTSQNAVAVAEAAVEKLGG
jgi:hypothetical protein